MGVLDADMQDADVEMHTTVVSLYVQNNIAYIDLIGYLFGQYWEVIDKSNVIQGILTYSFDEIITACKLPAEWNQDQKNSWFRGFMGTEPQLLDVASPAFHQFIKINELDISWIDSSYAVCWLNNNTNTMASFDFLNKKNDLNQHNINIKLNQQFTIYNLLDHFVTQNDPISFNIILNEWNNRSQLSGNPETITMLTVLRKLKFVQHMHSKMLSSDRPLLLWMLVIEKHVARQVEAARPDQGKLRIIINDLHELMIESIDVVNFLLAYKLAQLRVHDENAINEYPQLLMKRGDAMMILLMLLENRSRDYHCDFQVRAITNLLSDIVAHKIANFLGFILEKYNMKIDWIDVSCSLASNFMSTLANHPYAIDIVRILKRTGNMFEVKHLEMTRSMQDKTRIIKLLNKHVNDYSYDEQKINANYTINAEYKAQDKKQSIYDENEIWIEYLQWKSQWETDEKSYEIVNSNTALSILNAYHRCKDNEILLNFLVSNIICNKKYFCNKDFDFSYNSQYGFGNVRSKTKGMYLFHTLLSDGNFKDVFVKVMQLIKQDKSKLLNVDNLNRSALQCLAFGSFDELYRNIKFDQANCTNVGEFPTNQRMVDEKEEQKKELFGWLHYCQQTTLELFFTQLKAY